MQAKLQKSLPLSSASRASPLLKPREQMLAQCLIIATALLLASGSSSSVLLKPWIRFCYNPGEPQQGNNGGGGGGGTSLSSQCVYCNKNVFPHTLFECTGISAVTTYINTTQAFCIISKCIEQTQQRPIILGRRKKRSVPVSGSNSGVDSTPFALFDYDNFGLDSDPGLGGYGTGINIGDEDDDFVANVPSAPATQLVSASNAFDIGGNAAATSKLVAPMTNKSAITAPK